MVFFLFGLTMQQPASVWVALCVDEDAEYSAVPDLKGAAFHLFSRFMNLYSCKLALG